MLRRFGGLFRRNELEAGMKAEMQAHLDGLIEGNVAAGMSRDEARHAALREFGGMAQFAEQARDERRSLWGEQLAQDLRYAIRSLAKSPSFTLTVVLTLGLGIGVNAALFSVINMVGLRPLPVKDPKDLVVLAGQTARGNIRGSFSYTEYLDYRASNGTLEGLLAVVGRNTGNATFEDEGAAHADPARDGVGSNVVTVRWVSDNYFAVLGGPLQLGRAFRLDEATLGAPPVIVLSHLFWETRLRRDPQVIGRTLMFNREAVTVIGVASPEFSGHEAVPPAGWLPLSAWSRRPADYAAGGPETFTLIGRLKPGITEAQAKAELDTIAARRAAEFPSENAKLTLQLERGLYFINLASKTGTHVFLSLVFFGFGLVLALACTNVANLVLARNVTRRPEIGVRLSLGASRARIIRQLLTENLLLCVPGAVLGLVLATWTLQLLLPVVVSRLPNDWAIDTRQLAFFRTTPDLPVLGFTALLTLGAMLVTGLLPAWHASGRNLIAAVRNEGHPIAGRLTPSRLRKLLVIVQVAISLTLLSCAGLLTRSLIARQKFELGFDAQAVFRVELALNPGNTYSDGMFRQVLATVRAIPGVAVGVASPPPLRGGGRHTRVRPTGPAPGGSELRIQSSTVSEGTFDAFGIPLRRGRTFRESELHSSSHVVVVSETLARRLWPETDPLGQSLAIGEEHWSTRERPAAPDAFRVCEVIAVAGDIEMAQTEDNHELLYLPIPLDVVKRASLYVRPRHVTAASMAEIVSAAKVAGFNLQFAHRYSNWVESFLLPYYAFAITSASLGLLALGMASVGLYGLMTFSVHQRVREIGLRMALGATSRQVVRLFVREGLGLVAVGLVLGVVSGGLFALALSKLLRGFMNAFDPVTFAVVTLLFGVIAAFACWLPARRATKVNPMVALKTE
jgi:predicted permease